MSYVLGAIFSGVDVRDYKGVCAMSPSSFPKEFELPIVRVKSQGSIGSCVAHALSSVVEYYNYTQHKEKTEMSTGYIYGNRKNSLHKGSGMIVRDALATLVKYGDVPHTDFPYNVEVPSAINKYNKVADELYEKGYPNRISCYYKLKTENDIKASLMAKQPVVIAVKWYSDMKVVNGILTTDYKNYSGGHCMLIYGWNEKGWKVLNSWGAFWGNKGTCIIPYEMEIREKWSVVDNITEKIIVKKPFSSPIGKKVAKVLNTVGKVENKLEKLVGKVVKR